MEDWRRRYEQEMQWGAAEYADAINMLRANGLPTHFTQTGGMNAALEVQLENGDYLLITDAVEALPWSRANQHGWSVGHYRMDEQEDAPARFATTDDPDLPGLLSLVIAVLNPPAM